MQSTVLECPYGLRPRMRRERRRSSEYLASLCRGAERHGKAETYMSVFLNLKARPPAKNTTPNPENPKACRALKA